VTPDPHSDAITNFVHDDSITLPGLNSPEVQQLIHANHVLLH
jgi:hypothetical protein